MKFDLDTAWKDTTRLLRDSFGLLAVVAGVFYFLPYLAAILWIPGLAELSAGQFDPDSQKMEAMAEEMFTNYWWALLLLAVVQGVGFIAMLAMLRRRARPTVAEALQFGIKSVLSYLAASLLMGLAIGLTIVVLISLPAAIGLTALAIVGGIIAFVASLYLFTKFSLASPVIAMEGEFNPVRALSRSWRLTKGNSVRLFFFFVLLLVAYFVISALISMVLSLVFALGGPDTQKFGQAFSGSLMNALLALLFACVLAAVHTQLSRLRERSEKPDALKD